MLVLNRKIDEAVLIGDCIEVTVTQVTGGRVKLGSVAPCDVSLRRVKPAEQTVILSRTEVSSKPR